MIPEDGERARRATRLRRLCDMSAEGVERWVDAQRFTGRLVRRVAHLPRSALSGLPMLEAHGESIRRTKGSLTNEKKPAK
jgi:hypothetical protein